MPSLRCRFATVLPLLTLALAAAAQGTLPSQTQITLPLHGAIGGYGIPIEVRPAASVKPPLQPPTGTVTLFDGANAVGSAATLADNSGITKTPFAQVFGTPDPTVAMAGANAIWDDFNGDGVPDLLVYGSTTGTNGQQGLVVQDFLGKASSNSSTALLVFSSFTPLPVQQLALPLQTQYGQSVAVLDVDGDGHLDLLAGNTVAYGNGDGTFGRVGVLAALASGFNQTYAVDMDGDGRTDIVAVDTPPSITTTGTVQYAFTVFHNNGSGSFTAMGPYPLAPSFAGGASDAYNIFGLSFADANGDGRIDVLAQSNQIPMGNAQEPIKLNIMLNLGTGFSAPRAIVIDNAFNPGMISTAFTDLNGDGKLDLVLSYQTNTGNNTVATLLGAGDGTFAAPGVLPLGNANSLGSPLLPLNTEDINGDGKTDIVLGNGVVAMGNGDGTLTMGTPLFTSSVAAGNPPPAYAVLSAPPTGTIPGGETAPFFALVFINLQSGANAVFIPQVGGGATVTAMLAAGQHSLTAHYSGDSSYGPSVSAPLALRVGQATTSLTVTSSQNPSYDGGSPMITATVAGLQPNAGGTVTFTTGSTTLTFPLTNGSASFHWDSPVSLGTTTITATYSGDANNAPASGSLNETFVSAISIPSPAAGTTTLTVASGSAAQGSVTVSGAAGYSGQLGLACTGLPANASCSFIPQILGIGSGPSTFTFYVATNSSALLLGQVREPGSSTGLPIVWCGLPLLGMLLAGSLRRPCASLFCLIACFGILLGLSGCGGNSSKPGTPSSGTNTPPGTYTFQVNAHSGGATASETYTLIVQ